MKKAETGIRARRNKDIADLQLPIADCKNDKLFALIGIGNRNLAIGNDLNGWSWESGR
jgi:hypothetical protein